MSRRTRILVPSLALAAAGALLVACSDDGPVAGAASPASTATSPDAPPLPAGVTMLPAPHVGADSATLVAGRYRVPLDDSLAFDVTVPADSDAHDDGTFIATGPVVLKTEIADETYGVPRDACSDRTLVPAGTTVDDLVTAIRRQAAYAASKPRPVALGTASGMALDIRVPASYDASQCVRNEVLLPGTAGSVIGFGPGFRSRVWVLEVEGRRVVIQHNCACSVHQLDHALPILQSVTFTATP